MHEAKWENGGGAGSNVEAVGGVHPAKRVATGAWHLAVLSAANKSCIYIYVLIYVYVYITIYMCIYIYVFV